MKFIAVLLLLVVVLATQHGHQHGHQHKTTHGHKTKHRKARAQKSKSHKYVKKSNSGIATSSEQALDPKSNVKYLMTPSAGQELTPGDTSAFTATPEAVEEELQAKSAVPEEGVEQMYDSKWDLRPKDFTCTGDMFSGELYMVDKVTQKKDMSPETQSSLQVAGLTNVVQEVRLNKVTITANDNKITVRDSDKQLKDMVRLDQVYPKASQIEKALSDPANKDKLRTAVESLKIRILDASGLIQSNDLAFPNYYCMSVINEPVSSSQLEDLFINYQSKEKGSDADDLQRVLDRLYTSDMQNDETRPNVHEHSYYQLLTLCHPDLAYLRKWMTFINREKVDCHVEFNRKNLDIGEDTETVLNSGATSDSASEMMRASQARQEEEEAMAKKKAEEEKAGRLTQDQLNQKELERLTSELADLNESMAQEEQYSQKEINGMMGNIQNMQSSIANKGEQLQCLENALEIRQEEENTQVIRMLKDEEMSKVKSVISSTKEHMKEAYAKRIATLKEELQKQKQGIEAEKGNYDQLMVNLIKGGLRKGDKNKCVFNRNEVMVNDKIDETKLTDKMTTACSELLNQNENAAELQNGLLDSINKCTKKEMFCGQCCGAQFGNDELILKQDCSSDCQVLMDVALAGRTTYSAEVTGVIDAQPHKTMKAKIDAEMEAKKQAAMKSRFKSTMHRRK